MNSDGLPQQVMQLLLSGILYSLLSFHPEEISIINNPKPNL